MATSSTNEKQMKFSTMRIRKVVMVLGTTGTGKSTIINMLFNNGYSKEQCQAPCAIGAGAGTVTKQPSWHFDISAGVIYVDTIGLGDPSRTNVDIVYNLKDFIRKAHLGIHCLIIVARYGRITMEDRCNLKIISEIFDARWASNCIMVLTHYDGNIDNESRTASVGDWMKDDKEIKRFISKIGNRVILTDNSLGRFEEGNRVTRKECLTKLNEFIATRDIAVGPSPRGFMETLLFILDRLFSFYRIEKSKERLQNMVTYLKSNNVEMNMGECSICHLVMELNAAVQTTCAHWFHRNCLLEWTMKKAMDNEVDGASCPLCRSPLQTTAYVFGEEP